MTALEFYINGLKNKGFSGEKIKELTEHRDLPFLQFAEDYHKEKQRELLFCGGCGVIKSFLLLMWQTLAVRSVNAIFKHPDLDSKPKNVL